MTLKYPVEERHMITRARIGSRSLPTAFLIMALLAPSIAFAEVISFTGKEIGHIGFKATNEVTTYDSDIPTRLENSKVSFGLAKRSIVEVTFCSELSSSTLSGVKVQAVLDAGVQGGEVILNPGSVVLSPSLEAAIQTRCMTWVYHPVNPGPHSIEIQWGLAVPPVGAEEITAKERTVRVIYR